MLKVACALFLVAMGCSAIDDFGKFNVVMDGAADGADDQGATDGPARLGGRLGDSCSATMPCETPNMCLPLSPGGYCSRMCTTAGTACGLEGDCESIAVQPVSNLCLIRCDGKVPSCRAPDYACCDNGNMINSGLGHCAPVTSFLCRHP